MSDGVERRPIQLPPGVWRTGSEAEMAGRWYETQLVRWVTGVLQPVLGWEKIALEGVTAFASTVRATHVWTDLTGMQRTAILCDGHLYVLEGNTVIDISPTSAIVSPADDLTAGGYGTFEYNFDTYGSPRPSRPTTKLIGPAFTLDNWGEDLLAMVSTDGRLLRWKPSDPPGSKAVAVPDSPLGRSFVVTEQRHVMVFQLGPEFNAFGWCDQEDIENWDFADPLSLAGRYSVEPAGPILAARASRFGVLMFTPAGAYFIRYVGVPYVYTYAFIGKYAAPVSQACLINLIDESAWLAPDGVWKFNGASIVPVECPLLDWVQKVANQAWMPLRTVGLYLGMQTEAWFFFPSGTATENDRYLIWNFQEHWWAMGRLRRTCGTSGSIITYPLMSDGTHLYRHERGLYYIDAPELPYAQSGAINVASGARKSTVRKGIVDTQAPAADAVFHVGARTTRIANGRPPHRLKGPFQIHPDGKVNFRVTARDIVLRISSARSGVQPWTFGQMLVRISPRGQR